MKIAMLRTLGALALVGTLTATASAQSAGSITGTVKDAAAPLCRARPSPSPTPPPAWRRRPTSDARGVFVALLLPPGTYTVSVEMSGFKRVERGNIIVPTASKVNVGELLLEVGSLSETVTVEADVGRLQIQSESAERSDLVTNKQLRDLALNGRNITDLFKTIPGVVAGSTITSSTVQNVVGQFNINGTRANQHEYTVDGVTNLNLGNNTGALVTINPDALQEVKILTSNYQAEYGRAGGGFIALTTRSGTNEYRGGLPLLPAQRGLQRQQLLQQRQQPAQAALPLQLLRLGLRRARCRSWAPRRAAKVFFFAAQEYYEQQTPASDAHATSCVPTAGRAGRRLLATRATRTGRPVAIIDPADPAALPRQRDPVQPLLPGRAGPARRVPAAQRARGRRRSTTTRRSSPRDIPRREDIARVDWQIASRHAAERPLHPQQGRGPAAPGHHHRRLQLPAGRLVRRPQERPRRHVLA